MTNLALETRSGVLEFDASGYPTKETVAHILDEMDFQGATQAYLWATAILVNDAWRQANLSVAGPLDFVTCNTVQEKHNSTTSNMPTPYLVAFPNLKDSGPLILEIPAGPTGGILNDIEHRHLADTGLAGPDQGKGGKYLILHRSWDEPENHGTDSVIRSQTYLFWAGTRILTPEPEEVKKLQAGHKIYPLGGKPETRVISIGDRPYQGWHPDGMHYSKALHAILQIEDFPAEDRYTLQFLQRAGIEKGKPFEPTPRQTEILLDAEKVGKTMAMSLASQRLGTMFYGDERRWSVHLDGLVSYSWEAFSVSDGTMKDLVGVGSKYLPTYEDENGDWLSGSYTYQLTVPANVPAKQSWSLTVYSHKTRAFVKNRDRKPGVGTRDNPVFNQDGSCTITVGPERPSDVPESNFIYSNPNEGWFTYFRVYAPTEAYFVNS